MSKNGASGKKLSPREVSTFCTQIALILKAGIPLYDGISAVYDGELSGSLRKAVEVVHTTLSEFRPLWMGMEESGVFPEYVVNMTRVGDATGKLEDVMNGLADYYEREQTIRQRIRSAVVYPLILFFMMTAVIIILITNVLPMFESIYRQMGSELSPTATTLMNFGIGAGNVAFWVVAAIVIIAVVIAAVSRNKDGKAFLQRTLEKLPFTKRVMSNMTAHRFSASMALMLSSGANTDESLDLVKDVIGKSSAAEKYEKFREMVANGESLPDALTRSRMFPSVFSRMVNAGYKTGSADSVMKRLSDIYEEEFDVSLKNLTSMLEPVLVGILSVVIGIIIVSVMLPLAGIMTSIG
jgi:type IV pilus assembly protein PilC